MERMKIRLCSTARPATAALPSSLLAATAVVSTGIGLAITITIAAMDLMKDPNATANTAPVHRLNLHAKTLNAWLNRIIATRKMIAVIGRMNGIVPTPEAKVAALLLLLVLTASTNAPIAVNA